MDFTAAISHRHGPLPAINLAFDSTWRVLAERNRPARFATDNAMRAELGERLLALFSDGVTASGGAQTTGPGNIPTVVRSRARVYHPTRILGCARACTTYRGYRSTSSARRRWHFAAKPITPDLPILSHNAFASDAESEVQAPRKCKAQDRRPVSALRVIRPAARLDRCLAEFVRIQRCPMKLQARGRATPWPP